jgi:hypothetical protein
MPDSKPVYDRWVWVELTGFDNESQDFGVAAYIDNAGFVPDVVSLLLFNPDFVHTHDGMETDRAFPVDVCTYGGHPYGVERPRQEWTRYQLAGLVRELHSHGAKVMFAVFDQFLTDEWIGQHPEVWHVNRNGDRVRSICPWKRLSDGAWYEDFFAAQLARVLEDYEFDGFHQADGYSHPRLPLYEGDYSDDITGQFVEATGITLPAGLGEPSTYNPDVIRARQAFIWRNLRQEWLRFYAGRVARFCKKIADAAHAKGKVVVANNALTRDPFQALYRYGVDYKLMVKARVDSIICETVNPGVSIGAESGMVAAPHYDFLAMTLLMKSYLPDTELHCLNNAHDVNELWDVLRHGPTLLEREVYCNSNLYHWRSDRTLERCSSGPVVCLADGIRRHEWEWLREWWDLGFAAAPRRVVGATLVWSDRALERQLDEFIATRRWTTHKLLHELTSRGAPVHCAVDIADIGVVNGPLLVLNPQLLPEDELAAVLAYDRGPVIVIGGETPGLPATDFGFEDCYGPGQLVCRVYGAKPSGSHDIASDEPEVIPPDLMGLEEPPTYVQELYFRKVSDSFVAACADVIAECSAAPRVLSRSEAIRVQALELGDRTWRVLVGNDSHYYVVTDLDMGREIEKIERVTAFPGTPPGFSGSTFGCKVPGKGAVMFDVTFAA